MDFFTMDGAAAEQKFFWKNIFYRKHNKKCKKNVKKKFEKNAYKIYPLPYLW